MKLVMVGENEDLSNSLLFVTSSIWVSDCLWKSAFVSLKHIIYITFNQYLLVELSKMIKHVYYFDCLPAYIFDNWLFRSKAIPVLTLHHLFKSASQV